MSQVALKVAKPIGWGSLFILALLLGAFFASMTVSPSVNAATYQITTTAVDAGQVGVPYFFKFLGNAVQDSTRPNGGASWRIVGAESAALAAAGLTLTTTGNLVGTPNRAFRNFVFSVYSETSVTEPGNNDQKQFLLTIAGLLVYDSGPTHLANSDSPAVRPGQTNVPMFQFTLKARGEDMDITRLVLYGLGTGSDTFDVAGIKIWDDKNSNARVDGLDLQIMPSSVFAVNEGFLSSKVTFTFGTNILRIDSDVASGTRCLLITYDFKATVQAGRTFRLALEKPADLGYFTLMTEKTYTGLLGGGLPGYTQNNSMTVNWLPSTNFLAPYKGGIVTIYTGDTPTQATLYMNTTRDIAGPRLVRVGSETTALGLEFWTDSTNSIILQSFTISDSGTGDAATQIEKGVLYRDNDRNGILSNGDQKIQEASFVGDNLTFNLTAPITFNTPLANRSDPNALYYVVAYKFKADVPITTPNLTFQGRITTGTNITAKDALFGGGLSAIIAPDTPNIWGVPIAVNLPVDTAITGGTTSGPYPIRAIWYDVDTNHVASRGDTILVTFDTNLQTAAPTINHFFLPVLGDYLGNGASFTFMGGNRLRITLGDFTKLTISGVYTGAVSEGSASGINLKDTTSGITSSYGLTAGPAVQVVDIESGAVTYTASSSSSSSSPSSGTGAASSSAAVGDKACLIERVGIWQRFFPALRAARDYAFTSSVGRFLARIYYWL